MGTYSDAGLQEDRGATASSVYEWTGNEGGQSERTHDVYKRTAAAVREVGQIV